MKKRIVSLFCLKVIFSFFNLDASYDSIVLLNQKSIEHRIFAIDKMIRFNRIAALGLKGVIIGNQIMQMSRWLGDLKTNLSEPQPQLPVSVSIESVPNIENKKSWFKELGTGFIATCIAGKNFLSSGAFLKFAGYAFKEIGVVVAVSILTETVLRKVNHPDTIAWYVAQHAFYKDTIALAQEYAKQSMTESATVADKVEYEKALQYCMQDLVLDVEKLLSFMEYKTARLSETSSNQARIVTAFIFDHVNHWISEMNYLLHVESIDYTLVVKHLELLKTDLDRECKRFARIEKDVVKKRLLEFDF